MNSIITLSNKRVDVSTIKSLALDSRMLTLTIKYKDSSKDVFKYLGLEASLLKDFNKLNKVLCKEGGLKTWKIE